MSGRPAAVRARDVKQIIIGAKRAGAKRVVITTGKATITVPLDGEAGATYVAPDAVAAESNNSFDKIMRDK